MLLQERPRTSPSAHKRWTVSAQTIARARLATAHPFRKTSKNLTKPQKTSPNLKKPVSNLKKPTPNLKQPRQTPAPIPSERGPARPHASPDETGPAPGGKGA